MRRSLISFFIVLILSGTFAIRTFSQLAQTPPNQQNGQQTPAVPAPSGLPVAPGTPTGATPVAPPPPPPQNPPPRTLAVAVIDPAHGGADTGARGASGLMESDVVLSFARLLRISLEAQGVRAILTRQGNENPSFDDRSQKVNSQRGAVFITLHVSSTGPVNTVRVYSLGQETMPAQPAGAARLQLVPWNHAQQMYLDASQKLAGLVQIEMMQRFPGSPDLPAAAAIRQLRTVAAPAIAVEVSSVSVPDRSSLDKMAPILAEGVAQGVAKFRPVYEAGAN